MSFSEINVDDLKLNPMKMIGEEWWLITAGNEDQGYNGMTASWGHLGALWERPGGKPHKGLPTISVYVRPSRYTKEFLDREELFTLSVFDRDYRKALGYMGSHSGREEEKAVKAGLIPVFADGTTYFKEAGMVFICKKLYHSPLWEEGFVDKSLVTRNYPEGDFHEIYIGEIIKVLVKAE